MNPKWWNLDHFIFEEYKTPASSLGIYRILFAANQLLYLPQHLWVSKFPDSFFDPPIGLTLFFTGFPGASFFYVINGLVIVAAVCLLFGYRTRVASICFSLLLLLCNYWAYSFGKINHDIPSIIIPLLLQRAAWGGGYSMDAKRLTTTPQRESETVGWPLSLLALMLGLAMMSAAVPKAATGWLNPQSHAVRAHILYNVLVTGRSNWFAEYILRITSGAFWEFFDYATVVVEAAFLATVFRRRAFRIVCALACFFHFGIAVSMEIAFAGNILAYAAFCDWGVLSSRASGLLRAWDGLLGMVSGPVVLGVGAGVALICLRFGNPVQFSQEWDPVGLLICALGVIVASIYLIGLIRNSFQKPLRSVMLPEG